MVSRARGFALGAGWGARLNAGGARPLQSMNQGAAFGLQPRLVWSVGALLQAVADALAARFSACAVRGEVSGFSRAPSGHCYFNLRDADGGAALLRCAMFRRAAGLLDFMPSEGQLVELRGRLGVYEGRGELQLIVESMQRAGAGVLFEQFLKLKAKLEAEGLFDPVHKRPVPSFPRRVGVITSLGAAALRDVVTTFERRSPHVGVLIYPSAVQGAEAPASLCSALALANRRAEVDTLILCRGGGSLEDLWAFNDEHVVRAVRASAIPVICGVGHETDVSLVDFAADLRAPTPTAAAELAAPDTRACCEAVAAAAALLRQKLHDRLGAQVQRLDTLSLRLTRPAETMRRHAQRLDMLAHRLAQATGRGVEHRSTHAAHLQARLVRASGVLTTGSRQRLDALQARLTALDPRHVLARGYAWLTDEQDRPVTAVAGLRIGAALTARLVDGTAHVDVTGVEPHSGLDPGV